MTELIQTLAALTMIGALALICWCGHRQDQRRRAEEKARRETALQVSRARCERNWRDMCRQMDALSDDFNHDCE